MAKPYDSESSSEETPSNGSIASEDERRNVAEANPDEEVDEEELEAVARTAGPDDDEAKDDNGDEDTKDEDTRSGDDDDEDEDEEEENAEIGKRERARLREMQRMKKQKIQEILDAQNASIDADMVSDHYNCYR
ncbi:hypothetical protein B296_00004137 [Ensete ventricosum]|uniref:Uncharacterized protein n=1 Tax=Ensete ventricosum TaxID=4639 RepID=A0A427AHB9_ENSVE|nr:hypothetical protein B296_00004137 [Ensete ventricosum]